MKLEQTVSTCVLLDGFPDLTHAPNFRFWPCPKGRQRTPDTSHHLPKPEASMYIGSRTH